LPGALRAAEVQDCDPSSGGASHSAGLLGFAVKLLLVSRLAQGRQQQQNVEDAIREMQKPLARYIDDQDLDRMLREQEREGDPMADLIKKRKAKESKEKKGLDAELLRRAVWAPAGGSAAAAG